MTPTGTKIRLDADNGTVTTVSLTIHKSTVPECIADNGKFFILHRSYADGDAHHYREIIPVHINEL